MFEVSRKERINKKKGIEFFPLFLPFVFPRSSLFFPGFKKALTELRFLCMITTILEELNGKS